MEAGPARYPLVMPLVAVLSDLHANLEALEAVIADAEAEGAEAFWVLGDIVDYGPDLVEVLERVVELAEVWILGNHEQELLAATDAAEPFYRPLANWTHETLEKSGSAAWKKALTHIETMGFEGAAGWIGDGVQFAHATPRRPTEQYLWPAHECQYLVFNDQVDERLKEFMDEFEQPHGFVGHTHVPALLIDQADHKVLDPYHAQCERNHTHTFLGRRTIFFVPDGGKAVIAGLKGRRFVANPGSVGFPRRLGDTRPSYLLYDGDMIEMRRVAYDSSATRRKLADLPIPDDLKAAMIDRLDTGL